MNAVVTRPRAVTAQVKTLAPDIRKDFARGMAAALDLLRDEQASRGQDVTCYRRHREGRPQYRFWRQHLEKLVADPSLIEGFDAVMSAAREDGQCVEVAELELVVMDEYFAGVVGADGTVPASLDDAEPPDLGEASVTHKEIGVEIAAANTTTVLRAASHDANSDAVWGIFKLAELANEAVDAAFPQDGTAPDIDGLWVASNLYAQAIALCGPMNSTLDSEMVHAGFMLMEVTKGRIDALTESMQSEAQT